MDFKFILLALPIFFVLYQGLGIVLESRRTTSWSVRRRMEADRPSLSKLSGLIGQVGFNQALLRWKIFRNRLDLLLVRGGHPYGWKVQDLLFYKEVGAVLAAGLAWCLDLNDPLILVIAAFIGFWIPDIFLQMSGSSRRTSMRRQLPGYVDLLALSVESGLDLLVATERIYDKMKPGALRDEIQTLIQESRLGAARRDLLQRWAYRTGLTDAQSLVSLVNQSEEMGTPLVGVLRSYAEDMRTRRILQAEEFAGKIPVKILFPMMVFFFPIVFVIILGPMALDFWKSYR